MPQFNSGAAEQIGRFSEGLLLRLLHGAHRLGSGKLLGLRLQQPGINPQSRAEPVDHRRLIFVDEAHSIARFTNGYEFLLKMVEEVRPGIAFCFATTEVDRISAALRSRLFEIEIRPLGLDKGITFLRNIANKEGIRYDDEALVLLAGFGHGQPRNLLHPRIW